MSKPRYFAFNKPPTTSIYAQDDFSMVSSITHDDPTIAYAVADSPMLATLSLSSVTLTDLTTSRTKIVIPLSKIGKITSICYSEPMRAFVGLTEGAKAPCIDPETLEVTSITLPGPYDEMLPCVSHENGVESLALFDSSKLHIFDLESSKNILQIPVDPDFPPLLTVIVQSALYVSCVEGPIIAYNAENGNENWRWQPSESEHALSLSPPDDLGDIYAFLFNTDTGKRRICVLRYESNEPEEVLDVSDPRYMAAEFPFFLSDLPQLVCDTETTIDFSKGVPSERQFQS